MGTAGGRVPTRPPTGQTLTGYLQVSQKVETNGEDDWSLSKEKDLFLFFNLLYGTSSDLKGWFE